MAEETVGFTVKINGVEKQVSNLKELKLATKQAVDEQIKASLKYGEGSAEFVKASKAVSALKDKMDDLGDSTRSLKGSGIERSTQGFSALGEGLRNLDFGKVTVGLKAIKSALAATGIMLLVQGVTYLIQNFEELSQGSGLLAKTLQFVGDIITGITDKLYAITDALGLTNTELEKQGEAIKTNADAMEASLKTQTDAFDRQAKVAAAAGKSTIDIEKAKQQAIIDTNKLIAEQIAAFVRAGGELDDEKKKQLTAALETIKSAVAEQQVIEIKAEEDKKKKYEETAKKKKEIEDKSRKDFLKSMSDAITEDDKLNAEELVKIDERFKEKQRLAEANAEAQQKLDDFLREEKAKADQLQRDKDLKAEQEQIQAKQQATAQGIQAGANLASLVGDIALNRAKGNAAKEIDIKKKMFAVDKAFNVARAVQDGIRSVQAALTIPPPGGQILAGVNAAAAAINVGKILASKFEGGSIDVGSGGGGSVPNIGGNVNTAPPSVIAPNNNASTSFDSQGRNMTIRAEVVETQSRSVTERVDKLNRQAEY